MNFFVRPGDVTIHLPLGNLLGAEIEGLRVGIAWLNFQAREINGSAIEPTGSSSFEAGKLKARTGRAGAQPLGCSFACSTPSDLRFARMHNGLKKSPGRSTTAFAR
ncbi:MAG: hypothetical protein QM762_22030 [Chryseolinea sp.]